MKKAKVKQSKNAEKNKGSFFERAKKTMSPELIQRAEAKARVETFNIRLAALREHLGIKQTEIEGFSQTSISRLESHEDMKISTLLQYLEGINMDIEITVHPKGKHKKEDEIELLKTGS